MQISIIGAGFCGLATAWHLLQYPETQVSIFDLAGVGGGASGIAAGLLHPFAGLHAKLNWSGFEGMAATRQLLDIASHFVGMPVAEQTGLLRPAVTQEQKKDFAICASSYPQEIDWLENIDLPDMISFPGIFVKSAMTVNCELYLQGLWKACQSLGVRLERVTIKSLSDLHDYDAVVFTTGAATLAIPELSHLPITPVKGQILEFQWPENLPPFPSPINSQAYLINDPHKKTCLVGSTFERHFTHEEPDQQVALSELTSKFSSFFPRLTQSPIVDCRAGIRASTPDHLPILKKISPKCWILTGMNSKGLLYHAMMAKKLSKLLLADVFLHQNMRLRCKIEEKNYCGR